ncbi:cyclic nucleotide-binding domain-containing protein [Teredinibacter haidensis]|uniref:cyclic nucleotide-binding domain-containing protein n=1 Tax=Teredinibacter haidensis TaxID=2731755 RepID=UPI0009490ECC|nr:cyclic nucleotide-binding domain-containing protein [Teredinibacter haidensis]
MGIVQSATKQSSKSTNQDLLQIAQSLSPLKSMKPGFLEDLFKRAEVQTVFARDVVFEQGTIDNQHVYMLYGEVELTYPSGHVEIVRAGEQQFSLAQIQPRSCRATALCDTTLLRIDSDQLDRTLSWCQIAQYLMSEISLQRDLDEDSEWIYTVLNSNLFFKVPPVNVEQIFSRLTPMVVDADEVIVRQGEIGDCCYFIKEGDAVVTHFDEAKKTIVKIADICTGRCFGEDALVYEQVRNANVVMKTDGVLMRLEKNDFMLLLKDAVVDEVTEAELADMVEQPTLIDVRTDEEYAFGHMALSGNIPLNLLSLKKRLLYPEKPYVFYCDTGRRSRAAAYLLGKQGYNVMALKGGVNGQKLADNLVADPAYIIRDGALLSGQ